MNPYINAYKKISSEKKQKNRRNTFSAIVLAVFFLLSISFLLVYKHTVAQYLLLEVQQLKLTRKNLVTEQSVLLGEKQAFLSRARISSYAQKHLGLEFPSPDRIRWIKMEALTDQELTHASKL
ncbi:MAG TPA: cell division protein FtsL [archaeon]|nr:cell division protein FtsL [archaeon]